MSLLPGVAQSTYRNNFRGELPRVPLIKYKTLPCMYPPGATEPIRPTSQGEIKIVPMKRMVQQIPKPQGAVQHVQHQPVSLGQPSKDTSNRVFDTKFGPMDMALINKLYLKMRYSTFTQNAGAECALPVQQVTPPVMTKGLKPDMVRLKGQKYEEKPEDWQDAALWDRVQTRPPTEPLPSSPCPEKSLKTRQTKNGLDQARLEQITELVNKDALANVFVKKCPGYAGYAPLCPPETKLDDKKSPPHMTSLMTASYSKFPDHVLTRSRSKFARTGVFSKTTTLTYPFNPFNKIGVQISAIDKENIYAGLENYLDYIPGR